MECHVIGCNNAATKIITNKNGNHDMDLPVCAEHSDELTNENEISYDIE